uniref:Uncharacterized protein n=1 Tax=Rhizophora mucronata TaxID=61149 RepID=A0A2P2JXV8_RHIMU
MALHSPTAFCFGAGMVRSSRHHSVSLSGGNVKASAFSCPPLVPIHRLNFKGKSLFLGVWLDSECEYVFVPFTYLYLAPLLNS